MKTKISTISKKLFSIDLRALAALRVSMATLILIDLAGRLPLFNVFYVVDSPYPLELARQECHLWIFPHLIDAPPLLQETLFFIAAIFALSLLLGFYTRTSCLVSWYLLASMQFRNLNLLSVGDYVLLLVLFWSIFLPLGKQYSLDRLRHNTSKSHAGFVYSTASAAMLLQVAFVYFFASLAKMKGAVWLSGSAVEIVLNAGIWVTPFGERLLQFPSLLISLTYLTLVIEFFCPLLLFAPIFTKYFRCTALLTLLCFHIGIATSIALHLIPFQMTVALIPFLPSSFWNRAERIFRSSKKETSTATIEYLDTGQRWSNRLLLPVLVYITLANIDKVYEKVSLIPHHIQKLAQSLLLDQGWFMYAPTPIAGDYRVYLRGELSDGSSIHYAIGAERPRWPKTERWDSIEIFWNQYRARVYLYDKLAIDASSAELEFFLLWTANRWNESHPKLQLKQLDLYKVIRWPPLLSDKPDEKTIPLHRIVLN